MNFKMARELLELQNNFSLQELKKNYHMKALKTHPDKCKDDDGASEKFKKVNFLLIVFSKTTKINGRKLSEI